MCLLKKPVRKSSFEIETFESYLEEFSNYLKRAAPNGGCLFHFFYILLLPLFITHELAPVVIDDLYTCSDFRHFESLVLDDNCCRNCNFLQFVLFGRCAGS